MSGTQPGFLNRQAELARLQTLLRAKKSLLLYGPAGIGKSALLAAYERQRAPEEAPLVLSPGTMDPAAWLRHIALSLVCQHRDPGLARRLGFSSQPAPAEARAVLSRKSAGALRTMLFEGLEEERFGLVLDPLESLSRAFFELLRDLERATHTPLILAARSPHMEDIGQATRFHWPREQRVALGPLPADDAARLFDAAVAAWKRRPENLEAFRTHVLDYAGGNPGVLLGLLVLASEQAYWAGDSVKVHLLTVDFNLRGTAAAGDKPR